MAIVVKILKTWIGRLCLLGGSAILTVLLCELIVRVFLPQNVIVRPDVWIPKESIGHEKAANVDVIVNFGEGKVRLVTDDRGYRIEKRGADKGQRRILALGDSFLEAVGVSYEHTMTARIERALQDELGIDYRVVNTGVGGWEPSRYLIKARQELIRDTFDLVLVFIYLGNDLYESRRESYEPRAPSAPKLRVPKTLNYRELVDSLLYPAYRKARATSHLVAFAKDRFGHAAARLGMTKRPFPVVFVKSKQELPHWQVAGSLCEEIACEAAQKGTPTLFVLLPSDYQVDAKLGKAYARGSGFDPMDIDLDQPNRCVSSELTERGLQYIDTTSALRQAFLDGDTVYGRIDRHLDARGHEIVADELTHRIIGLLRDDVLDGMLSSGAGENAHHRSPTSDRGRR